MAGISRRNLIAGVAGTTVLAGAGQTAQAAPAGPAAAGATVVRAETGVNLAAQVSPDGRHIAIDLVGVLWVLPGSGGPARRLTGDLFDIAQPDWSPDGATIVFQSYRTGRFDLWSIRPDGSGLRQLTDGPFDHREPRFAPDGARIAYSIDRSGSYGIEVLDLRSGAVTPVVATAEEEYEPAWSPDGRRLAFVVANTRIDVADLATGARHTVVRMPAGQTVRAPAWTPDSRELLYTANLNGRSELWRSAATADAATTVEVSGEEVFPFRVSWRGDREFVYTADGRIRRRTLGGDQAGGIGFVAPLTVTKARYARRRDTGSARPRPVLGIGSPVLSPDGTCIAFRALNDIWTMTIGRAPQPLTRDEWWKCDPAWSPDGRYLSYSTDRSGKLDIWLRDLSTGADRQLTDLPNGAALSGSWSPDGAHLAFLDQTGALYTVEVATGAVQPIYAATFEPGRPTWSADGNTIALAAIVPFSARFREGLSKILLVDRRTGTGRYVDPLPGRSIQTRGDDGPVWSPDGTRLAFVVASVLWVAEVRADGTFTGSPRQITDEVTDAPSWSGDSRTLLYLHNGRLRLVAADGGRPRTVPMRLSWTTAKPRGRTVIHAGRLWDGVAPGLAHDVDVIVEDDRITAVEPHRPGRDGRRIDATGAVVIPGLIDMHHHREMQGYAYGARQGRLWLSMGITTTRSPGSPAYHMVEERESVRSGARIGPRYYATGEAIDGPRIYYNFMRPTYDTGQLALELQRAGALGYDLMKSYVRLPVEWQRKVIDWAHRHGVPATSHYHYPALAFGGDGMEHLGATSRFGYTRTLTALGAVHRDVADVFIATRAALTPTLFLSLALLAADDSLAVDERVRTLYPSWEYAALQALIAQRQGADQTANLQALARQVAHLAVVIRGGGRVVTGTDAPIVPPAITTHLNLRAMVAYGVTPYETLVSATRTAGEVLAEPVGRIAPGHYADLAVLGGDPLTDITQAANVQRVMVNGVDHTVPELLGPFTRPDTTTAAALAPPPAEERYWWHDPHYVADARHACCADG